MCDPRSQGQGCPRQAITTMSHVTASAPDLACFAVAAPGLERFVADELRGPPGIHPLVLGAPEPGGVEFRTDHAGLYAANLHLRIASRVLVRLGAFHASAFNQLERQAATAALGPVRRGGSAGRVPGHLEEVPALPSGRGGRAAALRRCPRGPSGANGPDGGPPQEFVVRLFRDQCTISADASGELLHRRGLPARDGQGPAARDAGGGHAGRRPGGGRPRRCSIRCAARGRFRSRRPCWPGSIPPGNRARLRVPALAGIRRSVRGAAVLDPARERILPASPVRLMGSDRDAGADRGRGRQRGAGGRRRRHRVAARRHLRGRAAAAARVGRDQSALRGARGRPRRGSGISTLSSETCCGRSARGGRWRC